MPLLLEGCPSFAQRWASYVVACPERLLYIDLGEFAHHVVELVRSGATSELPGVFDAIERLHLEGDTEVQEAATIGLLEGLQNIARNTALDPQRIVPWLRPESARWWAALDDFWDGRTEVVR